MDWQERIRQARQRAKHSSREALNILFSGDPHGHKKQKRAVDPHSEEGRRQRYEEKTPAERIINSPAGATLFSLAESKFLFEPDSVFVGADTSEHLKEPAAYGLDGFEEYTLRHHDKGRYGAWYKKAQEGFPTIAYCHGNAGPLDARAPILKALADRGFGVMIVAYPGFKGSRKDADGKPQHPSERGCLDAAYAMVQTLEGHLQVPTQEIVLFGESMGGSVALQTACRMEKGVRHRNSKHPLQSWKESGAMEQDGKPLGLVRRVHKMYTDSLAPEPRFVYSQPPRKPAAVVTYGTFASLGRRVKEEYSRLPVDSMANRFDTESMIHRVSTDVLLMHGTQDEMTGHHHSRILKVNGGSNVTLELLDGMNHRLTSPGSDLPDRAKVDIMIDKLQEYLSQRHLCPPSEASGQEEAITQEAGRSWQQRADRSQQPSPKRQ